MPGKVHEHDGLMVYHRPGGALTFHGVAHSRYMPGRDRKLRSKNSSSRGYPHSGDGAPKAKGRKGKGKGRKSKKKNCKCK